MFFPMIADPTLSPYGSLPYYGPALPCTPGTVPPVNRQSRSQIPLKSDLPTCYPTTDLIYSVIASIPDPSEKTIASGTNVRTTSLNNILSGLPEFAHLNLNSARSSKPLNHSSEYDALPSGTKVATPFHTSSLDIILSGLPEFAHLNPNFPRSSKPLNHCDSPCKYPPVMSPKHFEYGASPGAYSATFLKPLSKVGTFPSELPDLPPDEDDYLELEEKDNPPPSSPDSEAQAPQEPSSKMEQGTPLPEAQDATSGTTTRDLTPTDPLENGSEAPAAPSSGTIYPEDQQARNGAPLCGNQFQDPASPPAPPVGKNKAPATPRAISDILTHDPGGPSSWTINPVDQQAQNGVPSYRNQVLIQDPASPPGPPIEKNEAPATPRTIPGVLIHDPGGPPLRTYIFEDQKILDRTPPQGSRSQDPPAPTDPLGDKSEAPAPARSNPGRLVHDPGGSSPCTCRPIDQRGLGGSPPYRHRTQDSPAPEDHHCKYFWTQERRRTRDRKDQRREAAVPRHLKWRTPPWPFLRKWTLPPWPGTLYPKA